MGDADGEGDGLTGPDRLKYTEAFNIFDKHQQLSQEVREMRTHSFKHPCSELFA